ncbi:mechanosensitive ion channel domain-containing protein [Pollutimonas bauzanensis]|uniref:Small-conductance mechanosensitive channel n=1 Tax=Pollutimonas bauzanensis TaxID=658167 RepID=A0A1M5UK92_9BURK|nr:mechanosensitive ion channel domain-containing protein [Pollutimonas bauzanensis]SHH63340.1 Mechanosensitive ion channel [Pollutimonas bauzanensis]
MLATLTPYFPAWAHEWLDSLLLVIQLLIIVIGAWLLQRGLRRILRRASARYDLPVHLMKPTASITRWIIVMAATLLVLGRLGVSGTVLWTAFTGFAAVGAVAFFAAWSVLSNIFCAMLIFTARPFRLGDHVEILDTAEKPGARGEVVDISLLYVTLRDSTEEHPGALLQIPNALVFQRIVRRWKGGPPRQPAGNRPSVLSE